MGLIITFLIMDRWLRVLECPFLNLSDYHITFEFIACAYDFTLYSISSTLLYSTKSINPQVRTYMIRLEGIDTEKPNLTRNCEWNH